MTPLRLPFSGGESERSSSPRITLSVEIAPIQTTPPIGSPPNLGGEEITLHTSLRCLAHLAAMPPLFRGNAFHYIVRGIGTNHSRYSGKACQASARNTGQASLAHHTRARLVCHIATLPLCHIKHLENVQTTLL